LFLSSCFVIATVLLLSAGCSKPPAVQHDHLPLIASLRTACSARNATWLSGVERAVNEKLAAGKMTAAEHSHFAKLIRQANEGEWESAERACLRFEQAQLSRTRPPAETGEHSHSHSHD
jgi:hypothetical protein